MIIYSKRYQVVKHNCGDTTVLSLLKRRSLNFSARKGQKADTVTSARSYARHRIASQINGRHRFVSAPALSLSHTTTTSTILNPATLRIHLHLNERSIRRPVHLVAPPNACQQLAPQKPQLPQPTEMARKKRKGKEKKENQT